MEKLTLTPVVYNGDEVKFTIVVTNTGDIDLSDVTVKEYKFDGLEYLRYENVSGKWIYKDNTFKLAGNLTDTASFNVIFKAVQAGNITNIVSASSNKTTDTIANNTTEALPFIDFSIVKLVSNETSKFGDIITWTIIVSNNGLDEAVNVSVTDALPDGLILVNASGNYNNGTWIIDSIPAGENITLEIRTQVNKTNATIVNSVTVNDNVTATNSTVVSPLCDVEITKLVDAHIHDIADEIVWTIIVKNNGFDDALNVNVTDILPDTLSLIKANASVGSYSEGTWIIGTLKAGETQTLTLTTKATKDNITITNIAKVNTTTPESNYDNNVAQNTTQVKSKADLSIVKEVSNPTPNLGDIITYTITVSNKGSGDALDVEINDELPDGLVLVMAAGDWKADRLVAGESIKVTLDVLVNKTGEITNTATVTSTEDNKTTNKTVNVAKASDLEVWKIPNTEKIFVGDNLIWTITVKNNGPDAADNVKVSENLPKELQYVSYTATKGTYSKEGVWSVGTLASGESAVLHITTKVLEIGNITNPINASSDSYDFNPANNHANATVECVNKTPVTPQNATDDVSGEVEVNGNATGNPIALVVLALISILAGGYRRRK